VQASDNFRNLFEVPVLFYVHSFIHLTYNRVMHRFAVYVLSTVVLLVLWAALGIQVLWFGNA
jgi:hypothetical protein